jgi:hypothetical protein
MRILCSFAERFKAHFKTLSCGEITSGFGIPDFATRERIANSMKVINFATRETAMILFETDESFSDPRKEAFARREKGLITGYRNFLRYKHSFQGLMW